MSEHVTKNKEGEEVTPGMAFMGFIMVVSIVS